MIPGGQSVWARSSPLRRRVLVLVVGVAVLVAIVCIATGNESSAGGVLGLTAVGLATYSLRTRGASDETQPK